VGNAGGAKHDGEWVELRFPAAVALAIVAFEQKREKRKLMGMSGEFAGDRMAQIGEDGTALLTFALYGPEEMTRPHVLGIGKVGGR
jgi:hypothetical protein